MSRERLLDNYGTWHARHFRFHDAGQELSDKDVRATWLIGINASWTARHAIIPRSHGMETASEAQSWPVFLGETCSFASVPGEAKEQARAASVSGDRSSWTD